MVAKSKGFSMGNEMKAPAIAKSVPVKAPKNAGMAGGKTMIKKTGKTPKA